MSSLTIWKFVAPVTDDVTLRMPEGAEILDVKALTADSLLLWAVVDPDAPTVERTLHVRGTGHLLGEVGKHLASVTAYPFVWHVFEAVDPS